MSAEDEALRGVLTWTHWCDVQGEPGRNPKQEHAQLVGGPDDGLRVRIIGPILRRPLPSRPRFIAKPVEAADLCAIRVEEYELLRVPLCFDAARTRAYVRRPVR